jgi:hypothetical protein
LCHHDKRKCSADYWQIALCKSVVWQGAAAVMPWRQAVPVDQREDLRGIRFWIRPALIATCTNLPVPCKRKTHLTGGRLPPNQTSENRSFFKLDANPHLEGIDLRA